MAMNSGTKTGLVIAVICSIALTGVGQKKKKATSAPKPVNELSKLREDFIKATKEYKSSLEKLLEIYERNVTKAEGQLSQARELFNQGLISKAQLADSETALAAAHDKVTETQHQIGGADAQIADTLVEAQTEAQLARSPVRKGSLLTTTAYIRYNGPANWSLGDSWKVQRFFQDTFKMPLPVAVFGQGAIHDRWRLDHRDAMDISLYPDSAEGRALMAFLR
ncbi:MAG TPA: TolC family protein, partial [Pyrinomonadaceae bacterium]